uniref:Leucine-rich repeat-containing protein 51 n=1 Tax=Rhabditophanes sp. KR3021 TaxID=114890 RepID=A0AC35TJ24_9BILA
MNFDDFNREAILVPNTIRGDYKIDIFGNEVVENIFDENNNTRKRKNTSIYAKSAKIPRCEIYNIRVGNCMNEELQETMLNIMEVFNDFIPLYAAKTAEGDVRFYVQTKKEAKYIQELNKEIGTLDKRTSYSIDVKTKSLPHYVISDEDKKIMNEILSQRYVYEDNCLNLSHFIYEEAFKTFKCHVNFAAPQICWVIAEFIKENCPNITLLNLSGNRIKSVGDIGSIVYCARDVIHLDLSHNYFKRAEDFSLIKGWNLEKVYVMEMFSKIEAEAALHDNLTALHKIFPEADLDETWRLLPKSALKKDVVLSEEELARRQKIAEEEKIKAQIYANQAAYKMKINLVKTLKAETSLKKKYCMKLLVDNKFDMEIARKAYRKFSSKFDPDYYD